MVDMPQNPTQPNQIKFYVLQFVLNCFKKQQAGKCIESLK